VSWEVFGLKAIQKLSKNSKKERKNKNNKTKLTQNLYFIMITLKSSLKIRNKIFSKFYFFCFLMQALSHSLVSLNESHMKFLLWEDSLSSFLNSHKKTLDAIIADVEKKLIQALSFLRDFTFFLKIRINQIFEFSQFSMSKLPKIQKNAENLNLYPELTQIYQNIDKYNLE
jgi:hypothetical protein